jgi:hypothetical protein
MCNHFPPRGVDRTLAVYLRYQDFSAHVPRFQDLLTAVVLELESPCTGCMFQFNKKPFKITFLNRIPVLRYRGYRYSGTFFSTLYTYQLVL